MTEVEELKQKIKELEIKLEHSSELEKRVWRLNRLAVIEGEYIEQLKKAIVLGKAVWK